MENTFPHSISDFALGNALNSIGWYAIENKLSPVQVKQIFFAGTVALRAFKESLSDYQYSTDECQNVERQADCNSSGKT